MDAVLSASLQKLLSFSQFYCPTSTLQASCHGSKVTCLFLGKSTVQCSLVLGHAGSRVQGLPRRMGLFIQIYLKRSSKYCVFAANLRRTLRRHLVGCESCGILNPPELQMGFEEISGSVSVGLSSSMSCCEFFSWEAKSGYAHDDPCIFQVLLGSACRRRCRFFKECPSLRHRQGTQGMISGHPRPRRAMLSVTAQATPASCCKDHVIRNFKVLFWTCV